MNYKNLLFMLIICGMLNALWAGNTEEANQWYERMVQKDSRLEFVDNDEIIQESWNVFLYRNDLSTEQLKTLTTNAMNRIMKIVQESPQDKKLIQKNIFWQNVLTSSVDVKIQGEVYRSVMRCVQGALGFSFVCAFTVELTYSYRTQTFHSIPVHFCSGLGGYGLFLGVYYITDKILLSPYCEKKYQKLIQDMLTSIDNEY